MSIPSEVSSDGGDSQDHASESKQHDSSTQCFSSGDRYTIQSSDCTSSESAESSKDFVLKSLAAVGSVSLESSFETDDTTCEEGDEDYNARSNEDNKSEIKDSD